MRFLVIGAGGVGSVLAGYLARAGEPVMVVARPAHARAIAERGLEMVRDDGSVWHATPAAAATIADADPQDADIVFCTAKSYDTEEIVGQLAARRARPAAYICVQNGVTNEEVAARTLPHVYGAMTRFKGRWLEPGRVYAPGTHALTFGRYPRGVDDVARTVADRCTAAGIRAATTDDIMRPKWAKLIANCANAIYAIANVQIEEVWVNADLGGLVNAVWAEAEAVLTRAGIAYDPVAPVPSPRAQAAPPAPATVDFYGSTWDDLALRKGRTEVDWFNGEIVRRAAVCAMAAPLNRLLLEICTDMTAKREAPGRHTVAELRTMAERARRIA
jgi:2-dehydropantoate 2-reductase